MSHSVEKLHADGLSFVLNDPAKFNINFKYIMRFFASKGRSGKLLIPGAAIVPIKYPHVDDLDAAGARLYTLALTQPSTGTAAGGDLVPAVYGPDLTTQSYDRFARENRLADAEAAIERPYPRDIIEFLLAHSPPSSLSAFESYSAWAVALSADDFVGMWTVITTVMQYSNEYASISYLQNWILPTEASAKMPLASYIADFRAKRALVESAYADVLHPGYISIDRLSRSLLLIRQEPIMPDQVRRIIQDKPNLDFNGVAEAFQTYTRDCLVAAPKAAETPHALIAAPPPPSAPRRPIAVSTLSSAHCRFCATKGYLNIHADGFCQYEKACSSFSSFDS